MHLILELTSLKKYKSLHKLHRKDNRTCKHKRETETQNPEWQGDVTKKWFHFVQWF